MVDTEALRASDSNVMRVRLSPAAQEISQIDIGD